LAARKSAGNANTAIAQNATVGDRRKSDPAAAIVKARKSPFRRV
jgi:hypothetical protein